MEDAKRRRDAAAAAFDDMNSDEGSPAPARPAHFPPRGKEVEEPYGCRVDMIYITGNNFRRNNKFEMNGKSEAI